MKLAMTKHSSIEFMGCVAVALALSGCGSAGIDGYPGPGPGPAPNGEGKLALSWTLSGLPLSQADCDREGVQYMEVYLHGKDGTSQGYTGVSCALDRYSLASTPLGAVRVIVTGLGKSNGGACIKLSGTTQVTAGTTYPATPTPVALKPASGCKTL